MKNKQAVANSPLTDSHETTKVLATSKGAPEDPLGGFPHFIDSVLARLVNGAAEHRDRSFQLPPISLLKEIEEELLDVAGWSYILFHVLRSGALEREIETAERRGASDMRRACAEIARAHKATALAEQITSLPLAKRPPPRVGRSSKGVDEQG
jgi:hypothetical protein